MIHIPSIYFLFCLYLFSSFFLGMRINVEQEGYSWCARIVPLGRLAIRLSGGAFFSLFWKKSVYLHRQF